MPAMVRIAHLVIAAAHEPSLKYSALVSRHERTTVCNLSCAGRSRHVRTAEPDDDAVLAGQSVLRELDQGRAAEEHVAEATDHFLDLCGAGHVDERERAWPDGRAPIDANAFDAPEGLAAGPDHLAYLRVGERGQVE